MFWSAEEKEKNPKSVQTGKASDVAGIFHSFQIRIGQSLEGKKTQWWPRAGGCSTEIGTSCLGSILHNIYTQTHAGNQHSVCWMELRESR